MAGISDLSIRPGKGGNRDSSPDADLIQKRHIRLHTSNE